MKFTNAFNVDEKKYKHLALIVCDTGVCIVFFYLNWELVIDNF